MKVREIEKNKKIRQEKERCIMKEMVKFEGEKKKDFHCEGC